MMKVLRIFLIGVAQLIWTASNAQKPSSSFVIVCRDISNHEVIENVLIELGSSSIAYTNAFGELIISHPGRHTISASHVNYHSATSDITQFTSDTLHLMLTPITVFLPKADVVGKGRSMNLGFGSVTIAGRAFAFFPSALSEPDPISLVQFLPGVGGVQEMNSGLYIRGGNFDQSAQYLDGARVFNPQHALGLFSIYNADVIKTVSVQTSGISPAYGGFVSGRMDVETQNGNFRNRSAQIRLGTLSSSTKLDGYIVKDKLTYLLSARGSYFNLIPNSSAPLEFSDVNLKLRYELGKKHRLKLAHLRTRNKTDFSDFVGDKAFNNGLSWYNQLHSLRLTSKLSSKIEVQNLIAYSRFGHTNDNGENFTGLNISQEIENWQLNSLWTLKPNTKMNVIFGYTGNQFLSSSISIERQDTIQSGQFLPAWLNAGYVSVGWNTRNLKARMGIRAEIFNNQTDQSSYLNFLPRINFEQRISKKYVLKLSYDKLAQYQFVVSNTVVGLPTDVWISASDKREPMIVHSFTLSTIYDDSTLQFGADVFYKHYQNSFDFAEGSTLYDDINFESDLVPILATANGFNTIVVYSPRNFKLSLSYSYTNTRNRSPQISNGATYQSHFNRPHSLKLSASYKTKSQKWLLNCLFVLESGRFTTLVLPPNVSPFLAITSDRNSVQYPAYHRADFSATRHFSRPRKKYSSALTFNVYNIYNRRNSYFIYYDGDNESFKSVSLFQLLPSLSYKIVFN